VGDDRDELRLELALPLELGVLAQELGLGLGQRAGPLPHDLIEVGRHRLELGALLLELAGAALDLLLHARRDLEQLGLGRLEGAPLGARDQHVDGAPRGLELGLEDLDPLAPPAAASGGLLVRGVARRRRRCASRLRLDADRQRDQRVVDQERPELLAEAVEADHRRGGVGAIERVAGALALGLEVARGAREREHHVELADPPAGLVEGGRRAPHQIARSHDPQDRALIDRGRQAQLVAVDAADRAHVGPPVDVQRERELGDQRRVERPDRRRARAPARR
jgi:hypothetical protein